MRIYVWIEGQDVDCIDWASHSNGMNVTIGFTKGNKFLKFKSTEADKTTNEYTYYSITLAENSTAKLETYEAEDDEETLLESVSSYDLTYHTAETATQVELCNESIITDLDSSDLIFDLPTIEDENKSVACTKGECLYILDLNDSQNTEKVQICESVGSKPKSTLYSQITSENYGDYVNLGTNLVKNQIIGENSDGTGGTHPVEDWRIFYKDTTNNKVYLILADYLPYSYESTLGTGLTQMSSEYSYNYTSTIDRVDLLTRLSAGSSWKKLLNGTNLYNDSDVTVAGAVDMETFVLSWNDKGYPEKHTEKMDKAMDDGLYGYYMGTNKDATELEYFSEAIGDTLYLPHNSIIDGCVEYCIGSPSAFDLVIYVMPYNGELWITSENDTYSGIRPIVVLPSDILAESSTVEEAKVWTIVE